MKTSINRIEWVDALRGFAMILVIFNHIELFGYGNQPGDSLIKDYIATFFMPLFFTISGYTSYRVYTDWSLGDIWKNLLNKAKSLLIPTFVFGTLFSIFIYPFSREVGYSRFQSIGSMIIDPFKHGYWFTLTLFEMFMIFYCINYLQNKYNLKRKNLIWVLISLVLYILSFYTYKQYIVENGYFDKTFENFYYLAFNITSLNKTFYYFQWFMFGMLMRRNWDNVVHHIKSGYLITFSLIMYIPLILLNKCISIPIISNITLALLGYEGVIVAFAFFYLYKDAFSTDKFLGRSLQTIGKRTLDIYMLHYFFVPSLVEFGDWFKTPNNDIANKIILELFVGLAFAIVVIIFSLLSSNVLRMSPSFSKYLFGSKNK